MSPTKSGCAITVDVEGDFGTDALRGVDEVLPRLLDGFAAHRVRATLFVVGAVATKRPKILRRAVSEGHVIGSHGVTHTAFGRLNENDRRAELADSRRMIEDASGAPCDAFRAPFFDAPDDLGRLLEAAGYRWSSSKAPFSPIARYRWLGATRAHRWPGTSVVEHPVSRILGLPMPDGLSYRRLFHPLGLLQKRPPAVFYLHPYELLPTVDGFGLSRTWRRAMTVRQGAWAERHLWSLVQGWAQAGARFTPPDKEAFACVT